MARRPNRNHPLRSKPMIGRLLAIVAAAAVLATLTLFIGETVTLELTDSVSAGGAQPSASPAPKRANPPSPPGAAAQLAFPSDNYGFINSKARCTAPQSAWAIARTQGSLVVICGAPGRGYEYRGVRLSDGALLTAPAKTAPGGGFVAGTQGVSYAVSPQELLISADGSVMRREPMVEYRRLDSFPAAPSGPTSTGPTSTSPTSPPQTPPPAR